MPLQRAKDSILSLQEASNSSFTSHHSKSSSCNNNNNNNHRSSWIANAFQVVGGKHMDDHDHDDDDNDDIDHEHLVYWEPNEPYHKYEQFYKLKKLKPQRKEPNGLMEHCFAFCSPNDDNNDDSENDDELYDFNNDVSDSSHDNINSTFKLDRNDSMLSTTRREGGIAKRASMAVQLWLGVNQAKKEHYSPKLYKARPESKDSLLSGSGLLSLHVRFAPYKQVVPICPIQCMSEEEKRDYWWQLDDFEHFKTEISLIAKPEEHEMACTVWLANHNNGTAAATTTSGGSSSSSSSTPAAASLQNKKNNNMTSTNKKAKPKPKATSPAPKATTTTTTTKKKKSEDSHSATTTPKAVSEQSSWWHKYGDSRRGLEKIASSHQAKQTLQSYRTATRKVLQEQARQKFWHEPPNPEKIARVYLEYTAWSRDLALAAAASDADALRTNFDDTKRKSREFFLLKQIYKNQQKIHKHMPEFMVPKGLKPSGYLDEHDHANTYIKVESIPTPKSSSTPTTTTAIPSLPKSSTPTAQTLNGGGNSHTTTSTTTITNNSNTVDNGKENDKIIVNGNETTIATVVSTTTSTAATSTAAANTSTANIKGETMDSSKAAEAFTAATTRTKTAAGETTSEQRKTITT